MSFIIRETEMYYPPSEILIGNWLCPTPTVNRCLQFCDSVFMAVIQLHRYLLDYHCPLRGGGRNVLKGIWCVLAWMHFNLVPQDFFFNA